MRKLIPLLLLPLAACSVEKRPGADADTEVQMPGQSGDSVQLILSVPPAAAVGDEVPISIVVQNNRDRSIDLNLTGRELVYDIVVARSDSTVVWQRLPKNAAIQQIVQLRTLPPLGAFTIYDRWRPTEAGDFIIGARLPTDAQPLLAEPVNLTVR